LDIPKHLTKCAFHGVCSIYLEFCNERIPFKITYFPYLKLVKNDEIVKPFFEISLAMIFGLELSVEFPYKINYDCSRPKINNKKKNNKNKSKKKDNQPVRNEWIKLFDNGINDDVTETFKDNFKEFYEKISNKKTKE
jgi:hypothetical protein